MAKRYFFYLTILLILLSCKSNKNLVVYSTYDPSNIDFIPYSYNNINNDFLGYDEDYLKISFDDSVSFKAICTYMNNKLSFSISANELNFDEMNIKVESSNNGELILQAGSQINLKKNYRYFAKHFTLKESRNINQKVRRDTIRVFIDDKKFEFVSPKT